MNIEGLRRQAAERIRATHRRAGDKVSASRVTISEIDLHADLVRVEYADGEIREFKRCRPAESDGD